MPKKKESKARIVTRYLEQNPSATTTDVVLALKSRGVKAHDVSSVRVRLKRGLQGGDITYPELKKVLHFAREFGGFDRLDAARDALKSLTGGQ